LRSALRIGWQVLLCAAATNALPSPGFAEAAPAAAAPAAADRFGPELAWTSGPNRFSLNLQSRFRWERWEALTNRDDNFYAFRTRLAGEYAFKDHFRVVAEGQLTNLLDLDSTASGVAFQYRSNAHHGRANSIDDLAMRQLFVQAGLDAENWLRVGRQDINAGTMIRYDEPSWTYLKNNRLSQRLVGTVDWSHGARSFDGVTALMEQDGHVLHLYAAQPTTGVYEIEDSYEFLDHVIFGGLDWTVERGTWLPNTELGAFFVGYSDDRQMSRLAPPAAGVVPPFFGEIKTYTFGFSALGVYPLGPGNLDALFWGAAQLGQYIDSTSTGNRRLDQLAGAVIGEIGYQLPEVWAKPWLRVGVNMATGDNEPNDGDRNTFFNILPTNHLYYGYADQLAFSNLIDLLAQLKLAPLPKLELELAFHQFWLYSQNDFRYFGTGAFTRRSLGYGRTPSNGANNVGQEIDFVVGYELNKQLKLLAGASHLSGGKVLSSFADNDVNWAFIQVAFRY
jgi:hypothetical protein